MKTTTFTAIALGMSLVSACITDEADDKPEESDVKGGPDGKGEAWGSADNPALFNSSLEYKASELPRTGQATAIPWAGSYWPVYEDSINRKWAGASSESPSAKYGRAFGVTGVEDAVSRYHGIDNNSTRTACTDNSQCNSALAEQCAKRDGQTSGRCIPSWWGICHAWAPAAILAPEPKKAVTYNGVEFKINDIKALLTLAYDRTETKFVSLRCDSLHSEQEINFDKYGRPHGGTSTNCRDTNPGTFHVLVTNYLGKQGASFVYDRTFDGEVWNQPIRGYRITEMTEVSAIDANRAIGVTTEGGTTTERTGMAAANAFVQVGSFPVTAGQNISIVQSGTGDPDLHVKFGAAPSATVYDCRPYANGADEKCELAVPAGQTQVFIGVHGYGAATNFKIVLTQGGTVPTTYVFNPNAKKFFKVHMDVDYISESPTTLDGNLGATIDRYTHTDNYDYILELDEAGKIVGGEWLGASKLKHPDFVWLPIRVGGTSVAGGKITYANVKAIYDLSMQTDIPPPTGGDINVSDAGALAKSQWKHLGPYAVPANKTLTVTMTGDGDADLYVRKTAQPTVSAYDCRPYANGTNESCSIVGPANVYVSVNGYATTSNYQLTVKTANGGTITPPVNPPTTFTHLNQSASVTQGQMKVYDLPITAGRRVVIRTTSSADVDLYIQMDAAPTTGAYLARGYTSSGNETISYTPTSNGVLKIGVHGYAAGSFTVKTADQ
jgi:hypothetical protein